MANMTEVRNQKTNTNTSTCSDCNQLLLWTEEIKQKNWQSQNWYKLRQSLRTFSSSVVLRADSTSLQPTLASWYARCFPIPLDAPVTHATWPFRTSAWWQATLQKWNYVNTNLSYRTSTLWLQPLTQILIAVVTTLTFQFYLIIIQFFIWLHIVVTRPHGTYITYTPYDAS